MPPTLCLGPLVQRKMYLGALCWWALHTLAKLLTLGSLRYTWADDILSTWNLLNIDKNKMTSTTRYSALALHQPDVLWEAILEQLFVCITSKDTSIQHKKPLYYIRPESHLIRTFPKHRNMIIDHLCVILTSHSWTSDPIFAWLNQDTQIGLLTNAAVAA